MHEAYSAIPQPDLEVVERFTTAYQHTSWFTKTPSSQENINLYTAYSYFKGAFGGMDQRIIFKTMRELGSCNATPTHVNNSAKWQAHITWHRMATHPRYQYIGARYKGTHYRRSFSRYSSNHYYGGSVWEVGDIDPCITRTNLQVHTWHITTTDTQTTLAS